MKTSPPKELPVAVCAAVILHQGQVLLTRRPPDKPHGGYWEFPGGKIDPGESPHQALVREIREELDIAVTVGPVVETVYHHYDWGTVLIIAYRCHWVGGTIRHLEVADHRWVPPEDLAEFSILPADRPILKKLATSAP